MSERAEVQAYIATLITLIDDRPAVDDLCALLCAVGAACSDEALARKLLDAISPVMIAVYIDITAGNN